MRHAACSCGQLHLTCEGEPVRISMCHCLACQRRTGAVTSNQAWFPHAQVTEIAGKASEYTRVADSGNPVTFRFCPTCGSTVWWEAAFRPGLIAVAVGAFADPDFPPARHSVWEEHRHGWIDIAESVEIERSVSG